jgi:hypothetical protein
VIATTPSATPEKKLPRVYPRSVQFGDWQPIESAAATAPDASGVLQARSDDLLEYPHGRSAMVYYSHCPSGGTLRALVTGPGASDLMRAAAAGARWIRYAETSDPEAAFERLVDHFIERFGAPPVGNAPAAGTAPGHP